jgi:hypothetical protein
MDCRYGPDGVFFTWQGFDEMEPASGAGTARLDNAGALTGEIRIHFGEESAFEARRFSRLQAVDARQG